MKRPLAALFAWLALCSDAFPQTPPADDPDPPGQRLLVGAIIHGREVGSLDVRLNRAGYLIPLERFAELTGCTIRRGDGTAHVLTPMGQVVLSDRDLLDDEGVVYVRQEVIERRLATAVVFRPSDYALAFDVPWTIQETEPSVPTSGLLVPEALPPGASLSTVHADYHYTRIDEGEFFGTATTLTGRAGPGFWRLRYDDDLAGQQELRDYAWFLRDEERLYLAGHQRVRLHPLLDSLELTGVQAAFTNQPLDRFVRNGAPRELLQRRLQPLNEFAGQGPPAGVAELRVNGRTVERRRIGLDGRYEFVDVIIAARQANRVEVLLFDRRNPDVPIDVLEFTRTASEFLLDDGALVQLGGLGQEGNALRERSDLEPGGGAVGFYQARYGMTDRVTVEGAAGATGDLVQAMGGIVSRLASNSVLSVGLATSRSRLGYSLDFDWQSPEWRVVAQSQVLERAFQSATDAGRFDHYLETAFSRVPEFEVSLVGRRGRTSAGDVAYLLPAVGWRPSASLWLRARPDYEGDFRFDATCRFGRRTQASAGAVNDRGSLYVTHRLGDSYTLHAGGEFGGDRPGREELALSGFGWGRFRPTWSVGYMQAGSEPGLLLSGRLALVPGLYASARYESHSRVDATGVDQSRLLFSLTADLGHSHGRLVEAPPSSIRDDRGGIAGAVRIESSPGSRHYDLSGLSIRLDGGTVARTDALGGYYIGEVREGVYRLELDPEGLPIELVPVRPHLTVEVAGAAVTRADFVLRPEFGVAGRLRDAAGRPVPGARVVLRDDEGRAVAGAPVDQFGLFRLDGVRPGLYMLTIEAESLAADGPAPGTFEAPARRIEVRDDFLFDQDLVLPVVLPEPDPF